MERQHTLFLAFHVTRQTGEGLLMASGCQSVPSASRQVEGHYFRLCTAVREFLGNIQVCEAIGSLSHYQSIQCALMAIKEGQWQIASLQCWHWLQRFPLLAWEGGWCLCVFNMRSPIYPHVFAPQTEISQIGIAARVSVECTRYSQNIQYLLRLLYLLATLGYKKHPSKEWQASRRANGYGIKE